MSAKCVDRGGEGQLCLQAHYAAIVEAQKDVEIYQIGDVDCTDCLTRMVAKHAALAEVFRARLTSKKCRVYDTWCLNPIYCDAREACCAGDMDCRPEEPRALCHECAEMVEIVDGKLAPHHGASGDGCPLNNADVQIYLPPRVVDRIARLEASSVFEGKR